MSGKETSSRTCLIASVVLMLAGVMVISPVGGVMAFALSILFALAGVCLGYKRYGKIGIVLVIIGISLAIWRFPDARNDYGRYIEKPRPGSVTIGKD